MIMPRGQQLLLPANPVFVWGTLAAALWGNIFLSYVFGRAAWQPDLLALVLMFWTIHQPQRVGIGAAFAFGLGMDVHQGALLGQHALAYTVMSYLALTMLAKRLLWYDLISQALQTFPLLAGLHLLQLIVRLLAGDAFAPWGFVFAAPFIEAALWPLLTFVLLAPQMRTPEPDANRPL